MSENTTEPEAPPSTSQSSDTQKTAIFPLVSLPKIVLTRLDLNNLPVPLSTKTLPVKNKVKRLVSNKNKHIVSKTFPKNTDANLKHDTRFRGKPKKDYKILSEYGEFPKEEIKSKTPTGKSGSGIVKKVPKLKAAEEDNTVRGMLKKTMLQKRSKIVIPPAKKSKLMLTKTAKSNSLLPKQKKEKPNAVATTPKKEITSKVKNAPLKMDTDASEDEFLYDELIDELVNSPNKLTSDKRTNITLKPNSGNKPPTIVKGGIVKKSSLPPDLKSVASPTTLNSSKLTGTALQSNSKAVVSENVVKTPATADTPKASLPSKASPFPIAINSTSSKTGPKDRGKKPQKMSTISDIKEDHPLNVDTPSSSSMQTKIPPKTKPAVSTPRPRGRPRIGPKQAIKPAPVLNNTAADEESDEYTEVETLENIDSDPIELLPSLTNKSTKNEDIQVLTLKSSEGSVKTSDADRTLMQSKIDEDPHLDLLRILTDDTEDSQSEPSKLKEINSENPCETTKPNASSNADSHNNTDIHSSEKSNDLNVNSSSLKEQSSDPKADEPLFLHNNKGTSEHINKVDELSTETMVEEIPPVRTIYDLMKDVSMQYPSWNLHIIPETNAFCIAQVTKGRLGLPTLKKCIELDADTYSAKVYIHQYHIKRFDGVYDSEETILALIEEIHSIKA